MKLPFDEIIELSRNRLTFNTSIQKSAEDIEDEIEELLVMSYALGWGLLDEELGKDTPIDNKRLADTLEEKINGKTYKEYLAPHIEDEDIDGIYRVVDSEIHRMYSAGQYDNAKTNGKQYKTWRTMEDDKVRDMHRNLDKVKVGIDEKFYTTDGDSAIRPGQFSLPENNVNCRCSVKYT